MNWINLWELRETLHCMGILFLFNVWKMNLIQFTKRFNLKEITERAVSFTQTRESKWQNGRLITEAERAFIQSSTDRLLHRSSVINGADPITAVCVMNESCIILPSHCAHSLFVQEAAGMAPNQHFNLPSWHNQFTHWLNSFVSLPGLSFS